MVSFFANATALLALAVPQGAIQDAPASTAAAVPSQELAPLVEQATGWSTSGPSALRVRAARRLAELGAPAGEYLAERVGEDAAALVALGPNLVGVLGSLDSVSLRRVLWKATRDRAFPWRIAAAGALAGSPQESEKELFAEWLEEPLAAMRVAGLDALEALNAGPGPDLTEKLLADPDGGVRRRTAGLVFGQGEFWSLAWLIEEMQRDDSFLGTPDGLEARFDAHRRVVARLGEGFDFRPERAPLGAENTAALVAMLDKMSELTSGAVVALPGAARATQESYGGVVSLELRSSLYGDLNLRWDEAGDLWFGRGKATRMEGTGKPPALEGEFVERPADDAPWDPGCDFVRIQRRSGDVVESRTFLRQFPGQVTNVEEARKAAAPLLEATPAPLDESLRTAVEAILRE